MNHFGKKIGTKKCYHPKEDKKEEYELLQASRGNPFDATLSVEENVEKIKVEVSELHEIDHMRFKELRGNLPAVHAGFRAFVEVGFRQPRLLHYMKYKSNLDCVGFDVVKANVLVAKELGFDAHVHNMADENTPLPSFPPKSIIVCYHMLEHIPDPRVGLKKIYDAMVDKTSVFHVEIPCESAPKTLANPNLDAGHLYNFAPGELVEMAREVGFTVHYSKYGYSMEIGYFDALVLSKMDSGEANVEGTVVSNTITSTTTTYNMALDRDLTRYGKLNA